MDTTPFPIDVAVPHLAEASSEQEFYLHLAALEWSLADPIVLDSTDDIQSKVQWREGFAPFRHQVRNLFTFCRNLPVTLLADDVGLGKTISAALILAELMKRRRVRRTLVLCPKILCGQWVEELESKVGIIGRTASGADLDSLLRSETEVVVTTYDSARTRLDSIRAGDFDMIILDEAHKLRNLHGTKKPPKHAQAMHRTLERRLFRYVLMLTATPIQNRVWDLYSLVDLMAVAKGHKNPLGTPEQFSNRFVADRQTGRRLVPESQEEFRRILRRYVVRTRRRDAQLAFPDRRVKMFPVPSTAVEIRLLELLREGLSEANALVKISLAVALMSSPQAFAAQLHSMAVRNPTCGRLASQAEGLIASAGGRFGKESGLLDLLDQLRNHRPDDWRCVVFTTRKETQKAIGRLLDAQGIQYGYVEGGQAARNAAAIKSFMKDPPEISVLVSTDAGAEGVNLQKCNVLVNYDLPWNPMIVEQRIGRIQRLASKHKFVTVLNLCLAGSPEERIVGRLVEKLQTISQTVGDIEAILESAMDGSGDVQTAFESQILELVRKSLEGQDVEEATRLQEKSLLEAKNDLAMQEQELNQKLGDLDELHEAGPRPPRLERVKPSTPFREFVEQAIGLDGGVIEDAGDGLFTIRRSGRGIERATFSEESHRRHTRAGQFSGVTPKLFEPGRPDFERLVQHWIDRGAARVMDEVSLSAESAKSLVAAWWAENTDLESTDSHFVASSTQIKGSATVKVVASNAVDSYEKLIDVDVLAKLPRGLPLSKGSPYSLGELIPNLPELVRRSAVADQDIRSFAEFYQHRLVEERQRAGGATDLIKKVTDDFSPVVHCEVVALQAKQDAAGKVTVTFDVGDGTPRDAGFRVDPAAAALMGTPLIAVCSETRKRAPADSLEPCGISGSLVLPSQLAESDETGKRGLRRLMETCSETGKLAFADEMEVCSATGKVVVASALGVSELSGRRVLSTVLKSCDFTGSNVLADELARSEVSGKRFRSDEGVRSSVSQKLGHTSEFIRCVVSDDWMLPEETLASDVSGERLRADLAVRSEKAPYRLGLPSELVACGRTNHALLRDEVAASDVSGTIVDREILVRSASGKGLALEEELVLCEVSKQRLLPVETDRSEISGRLVDRSLLKRSAVSSKLGVSDEMVQCECTGDWITEDECSVSEVSGKRFRSDQSQRSVVSGVQGHVSELSKCHYTGDLALNSELVASDLSGKPALERLLIASELSGRRGVEQDGELAVCEVTGQRLLLDETGVSVVSGRRVELSHLTASSATGRLAMKDELQSCEHSGAMLLPDEVERCGITGKIVDRRLLGTSDATQRRGLKTLLEAYAKNQYAFPEELTACEVSGRRLPIDLLARCAISNKRVDPDILVASQVSGRTVLPEHAVSTRPNGTLCVEDEVATCPWGGYVTPKTKQFKCEWTGLTLAGEFRGAGVRMRVLEQMLVDPDVGEGGAHLGDWLEKQAGGALKGLTQVRFAKSPTGSLYAFVCSLTQVFGLRNRLAVFVATTRGGKRLVGDLTLLKVSKGKASPVRKIDLGPL